MGNCISGNGKFEIYASTGKERVKLDTLKSLKEAKNLNVNFINNSYYDFIQLLLKQAYLENQITLKQMLNFRREDYDNLSESITKYKKYVEDESLRLSDEILEKIKNLSIKIDIVAV